MTKLVALKTLRYPRGPGGREYGPGDPFDVPSERDAKALKLVRAAEDAPVAARPVKAPAAREAKVPAVVSSHTPNAPEDGPVAPVSTESAESLVPGKSGRYRRGDMRAEE